jgi:hypothetical protein
MCSCTIFPTYNNKIDLQLPSNPSARRFLQCLSHLCFHCIVYALLHVQLAPCQQYWTRALECEAGFYTQLSCIASDSGSHDLHRTLTREQHRERVRDLHRRLVPTMGQLGWQLLDDGLNWSRRPSFVRAS